MIAHQNHEHLQRTSGERCSPQHHLDRMTQFEKLFVARLKLATSPHQVNGADRLLINDVSSHLRPVPKLFDEAQIIPEIQRSPALSRFVFGDFADPDVIQPRQQSIMDVLVRAEAVVPLVLFLPLNLRKVSIGRALCLNRLYDRGRRPLSISTKREMFDFVSKQILAWKLMQMVLPIVAPLLVQFIGHHLPPGCPNKGGAVQAGLLSPWSGFARVFHGMEFYRHMSDVIENPRRTLQFAIRMAEEDTGKDWSLWSLARDVNAEIDPRLRCLVDLVFENLNSNSFSQTVQSRLEDELLWRMYRTVFKLDMTKAIQVCKDWLTGGVQRRINMLNDRFYSLIEEMGYVRGGEMGSVSVEVSRLESTQRLVVLYLTGTYRFARRGRHRRMITTSGLHNQGLHSDDDHAFVKSLFSKRVSIVRVAPA